MDGWDYRVDTVYDDFTCVPADVLPNQRMTIEQYTQSLKLLNRQMAGQSIRESEVSQWTLQRVLQSRGRDDWEVIQMHYFGPGEREYEPGRWRVVYKRPARPEQS